MEEFSQSPRKTRLAVTSRVTACLKALLEAGNGHRGFRGGGGGGGFRIRVVRQVFVGRR
jgi:hypothetical protein